MGSHAPVVPEQQKVTHAHRMSVMKLTRCLLGLEVKVCQIHLLRRYNAQNRVFTSPPAVKTQLKSPLFHSSKEMFTVIVMTPLTVQKVTPKTHRPFRKHKGALCKPQPSEIDGERNTPLTPVLLMPLPLTLAVSGH